VVAFQENRITAAAAIDQQVERQSRVRSAVDIVAEIYLDRAMRSAMRDVGVDDPEHLLEQMCAAVNIADRIDSRAIRQSRLGPRFRG
jgi:hypothetical protein